MDTSFVYGPLHLLILLGMAAYALAYESPAYAVAGIGGTLLSMWLTRRNRLVVLPRLVANVITIAALAWAGWKASRDPSNATLMLGQFLLIAQLVKLWQVRKRRDDGQLLVMNLIMMVVASINTTSLLSGLLLLTYLPVGIYCALLFQLRSAAERARTEGASAMNPSRIVGNERSKRQLTRCVRRFTAVLATTSLLIASVVFVAIPRGKRGEVVPVSAAPSASRALSGFNDHVSFGQVTSIAQSEHVVGSVDVSRNGAHLTGQGILLRGLALDTYSRVDGPAGATWQWTQTTPLSSIRSLVAGETMPLTIRVPAEQWAQKISMEPTGTDVLFAVAGPVSITPINHDIDIRLGRDGSLHASRPLREKIEYSVVSSGLSWAGVRTRRANVRADDAIDRYARRPDVSGSDGSGPLAGRRPFDNPGPYPLDKDIATHIAAHLHSTFVYTLDVGETAPSGVKDPLIDFLYQTKRGNCEYFAGAMALLCQRLGLRARVVTGFKCDEYNGLTGTYVVRQSHAHAWVEVLTTTGWATFDPTAAGDVEWHAPAPPLWKRAGHLVEYLQVAYQNHVVAFDADEQKHFAGIAEQAGLWTRFGLQGASGLLTGLSAPTGRAAPTLIPLLCGAAAGLLLAIIILVRRISMRRISPDGLSANTPKAQLEVVRFYDQLVQVLDRRHIVRARHLTQLEFSATLLSLPPDIQHRIQRLTLLFYRVRFGYARLSQHRQARLLRIVDQLEQELAARDAISR